MRYRLHGVTVMSELALPGVRKCSSPDQIAIEVAGPPHASPIDAFHYWRLKGMPRSRPWLSIARAEGGYLLRFPELADFDVSAGGDRIVCRPRPRLAASTLVHLLLDQVLPLALSRRGQLVLHASAVHIPRLGAVAFVGSTGSGKSTLAAALGLGGCQVITDDCLAIDVGVPPLALPGYPGLRLWRDAARSLQIERHTDGPVAHYTSKRRFQRDAVRFRSATSPLAAVFVLGRRRTSGATRAHPLASRDGLMALASFVHVLDVEDRRQLAEMFRGLTSLVTRVPVARLNLRDGRRQVRDAATEVLAIARSLAAPAMINRK